MPRHYDLESTNKPDAFRFSGVVDTAAQDAFMSHAPRCIILLAVGKRLSVDLAGCLVTGAANDCVQQTDSSVWWFINAFVRRYSSTCCTTAAVAVVHVSGRPDDTALSTASYHTLAKVKKLHRVRCIVRIHVHVCRLLHV